MARSMSAKRDVLDVSASAGRQGVPHMTMLEDSADFEVTPVRVFTARWQLFLPTLAIALFYSGSWFLLYSEGREDSSLARLYVIVLALGVPLLAAHAFLRFQTVRLQVLSRGVRYHPGWPNDLPVDLPYDLVERVRIKRGLIGWIVGAGTLVLDLTTGERVAIADLDRPAKAKKEILEAMGELPVD
jgi:hypothetical protein